MRKFFCFLILFSIFMMPAPDISGSTIVVNENEKTQKEKAVSHDLTLFDSGNRSYHPDYQWLNPSLNNSSIMDLVFIDENVVLAAGRYGLLIRSEDGGQSWELLSTPFDDIIRALAVRDELLVLAGNDGFIGVSNNMGEDWIFPDSQVEDNLRDIFITDDHRIYIAGESQNLLFSDNDGQDFEAIDVPDVIYNPNDIADWTYNGINVSGDVIMMGTGAPGVPVQVVRTDNHGDDWYNIVADNVNEPPSNIGTYLTGIKFAEDGLTGFGTYWSLVDNGVIKTTDGGESWARVESLYDYKPIEDPNVEYQPDFVHARRALDVSGDGNRIITSGSWGQIITSDDGGESWEEIYGGPLHGDRDYRATILQSVKLSPDGQGWLACGVRGLVIGADSFDQSQGSVILGNERQKHLHDVVFLDSNHGFAVGGLRVDKYFGSDGTYHAYSEGIFLVTEDKGKSWERMEGPGISESEWMAVDYDENDNIWIGGVVYEYEIDDEDELIEIPEGVIMHSPDKGENWEKLHGVAGAKIVDVSAWGEDHVYAVTNRNTMVRCLYNEACETISLPDIVSDENPANHIELLSPYTLLIGGGSGDSFILKSSNAGDDWDKVFNEGGFGSTINHISFVDGRFGFAGGRWGGFADRGNIIYTDDYGDSWEVIDTPGNDEVYFVANFDNVTAFGYGSRGYVIESDDAESFSLKDPRFFQHRPLGGYAANHSGLIVSGENGMLLRYDPREHIAFAPSKFANTYPINQEEIFIPWDDEASFTWEKSYDDQGNPATYVFILEDIEGEEVLFRSEMLEENYFAATTDNFPTIAPQLYRWRVEAHDDEGKYSSSYPTEAFVDVDDFINDQNDIVSFVAEPKAAPSEIDKEAHTVDAHVIYGTDITSIEPEIEVSHNATIDPDSGEAQDFSEPVIYQVTAQNGDTQDWTVRVHIADPIDKLAIQQYQDFHYSMIPMNQMPELNFETKILHKGHRDVTDVVLHVNANNEEIGQSEPLDHFEMGDSTVLSLDPPYELTQTADYAFDFEITIGEEDPNLTGHTAGSSVQVTDSVFAKDHDVIDQGLGSNTGPIHLANIYELLNEDYLSSISIGWAGFLPDIELDFTVSVYRVDKETLTTKDHILTSENFQRTPDMGRSIITFGLDGQKLEAGHYAFVVNQLTAEHIGVGFSADPEGYFYIYNPDDGGSFSFTQGEDFGYLVIRANFCEEVLSDDAYLEDLKVEGETIDAFDPDQKHYTYAIPEGTVETPEVTAVPSDQAATVQIDPASDVTSPEEEDRSTHIEVTAEDMETVRMYTVEFEIETSIGDVADETSFELYPNPASNLMFVRVPFDDDYQLSVTSIDGKVLIDMQKDTQKPSLDVSGLEPGVYLIQVRNSKHQHSAVFSVVR